MVYELVGNLFPEPRVVRPESSARRNLESVTQLNSAPSRKKLIFKRRKGQSEK